jgi:protoheme IX farnesyltransferase
MKAYVELTKPRITWLILMSTAIGYYFGQRGALDWALVAHTLIGTALIASGTAALNQWYERDADALMRRTAARPLPGGRVSVRGALLFGLALILFGEIDLYFGCNPLTAGLGLFTVASYLLLYTPLKQRTSWSTAIGAVPGAMPPLIGFAAARGALTVEAWVLFLILFLWQFPHFHAIAWMYRDDYRRAGIRMLPVIEPDGGSTVRQVLLAAVVLIPISLLPGLLHMTHAWYGVAAFVLGALFLASAVRLSLRRTAVEARGLLRASVMYLPLLFLSLVLAGCVSSGLPELGQVPRFQFIAADGQPFDSAARLDGRVWVADFFFTSCQGPCPRMSSYMLRVQQATRQMPDVQLVSFTVDPANDTPARLAEYATRFKADPARWHFLTGAAAPLARIADAAFHLGGRGTDHGTRFALVDRKGRIRAYYEIALADSFDQLMADLARLRRERS